MPVLSSKSRDFLGSGGPEKGALQKVRNSLTNWYGKRGPLITETPVYRMAERLAEWGVNELDSLAMAGNFDFV